MYSRESKNSKPTVGIVILIDDEELSEEVKKVIENLKNNVSQRRGKQELGRIEIFTNLEDLETRKVILVTDNTKSLRMTLNSQRLSGVNKVLFFVDKAIPSSLIDSLLDTNIAGIFSKRSFMLEYEEKGMFEARVKDLVREFLMDELQEQEMKKNINWKYEAEGSSGKKFVSLFLDPSMQKTVERIRYIISKLKQIYKDLGLAKVLEKRLSIIKKHSSGNFEWSDFEEFENIIKDKFNNYRVVPSVLIEGPTGSGKSLLAELIARSIFETASQYIKTTFDEFLSRISILNMGNFVETELFGNTQGAYTDANDYPGEFLSKAGGVVFLDEIAEIDTKTQAKLLLYLDDWRVRPLGLSKSLLAPTIVIAATNKDLDNEIKKEQFRADLYRRFLFRIKLPSLNERKSDFRLLISFVLTTSPYNTGVVKYISLRAIEKLEHHKYSGNFRELEEILNNALIRAEMDGRDTILEKDLEI